MWCLKLSALLARYEQQGRSGEIEWRLPQQALVGATTLDPALDAAFDAAWRQGQSLAASMAALRRVLDDAGVLRRSARALQTLFTLRLVLGLAVALLTRYVLLDDPGWMGLAGLNQRDLAAMLLAAAVAVAALALLTVVLPTPWVGRAAPSPRLVGWLRAHLVADAAAEAPLVAELVRLRQRELQLGISLTLEKRLLLEQWARDEMDQARKRLRTIEDLLPLWELIGVGLPVVLVLLEVVGTVLTL